MDSFNFAREPRIGLRLTRPPLDVLDPLVSASELQRATYQRGLSAHPRVRVTDHELGEEDDNEVYRVSPTTPTPPRRSPRVDDRCHHCGETDALNRGLGVGVLSQEVDGVVRYNTVEKEWLAIKSLTHCLDPKDEDDEKTGKKEEQERGRQVD
ncbi:hypothetical protein NHX12_004731 [Muraenolepis orangiensis]|uniref:Uncharacterized protein n=1 Tax=Muraenolepis orangiensis TaxID=630683 RepID=A0A9Q0DZL9_9TELE|nr:hypothetical protein NHX12_004731 [Muraenolepis orangiensis]